MNSRKALYYGHFRRTKLPKLPNISSQSRYDHFDTAPYLSQHQHLGKRGELMGRTSKNIKLRIPEKPHKIKGFRSGSYRVATTISSQGRYDLFDTCPYIKFLYVKPTILTKLEIKAKFRAKQASFCEMQNLKTQVKSRLSVGRSSLGCITFRVRAVMTSSIPVHILFSVKARTNADNFFIRT